MGVLARFLAGRQAKPFDYFGVDFSAELLAAARQQLADTPRLRLQLIERDIVFDSLPALQAQLVTLFGLLHHVPGGRRRQDLLKSAAAAVLPGGWLVFAAWRFYEQERFRRRIAPWGDEFNGGLSGRGGTITCWIGGRGERALRYCHYIDDEEHCRLIEATGLTVIDDYRADGAAGGSQSLHGLAAAVNRERSEPSPLRS